MLNASHLLCCGGCTLDYSALQKWHSSQHAGDCTVSCGNRWSRGQSRRKHILCMWVALGIKLTATCFQGRWFLLKSQKYVADVFIYFKGDILRNAQGLILALCSGINPCCAQGARNPFHIGHNQGKHPTHCSWKAQTLLVRSQAWHVHLLNHLSKMNEPHLHKEKMVLSFVFFYNFPERSAGLTALKFCFGRKKKFNRVWS